MKFTHMLCNQFTETLKILSNEFSMCHFKEKGEKCSELAVICAVTYTTKILECLYVVQHWGTA